MNSTGKERVHSYLLGCFVGFLLGWSLSGAIFVSKAVKARDAAIAQESVCQWYAEEAVAGWEKCAQQYKLGRGQ